MKMALSCRLYTLLFALVVIVAETLILIKTDKYWPLSLDDYIGAALLVLFSQIKHPMNHMLALASWTYLFGNLYAMLFTRLHPVSGSGERIGLLIAALIAVAVGIALTLYSYKIDTKR